VHACVVRCLPYFAVVIGRARELDTAVTCEIGIAANFQKLFRLVFSLDHFVELIKILLRIRSVTCLTRTTPFASDFISLTTRSINYRSLIGTLFFSYWQARVFV
jgi:hypothetical protein